MSSNDLIEIRKKLGLNQEQMASLLQVSQPTIVRWERGQIEPGGDTANRLKQLQAIVSDQEEQNTFKRLLGMPGGMIGAAAIVGIAGGLVGAGLMGLAGLAKSGATQSTYRILKELLDGKD